jgi:hypothetical protein
MRKTIFFALASGTLALRNAALVFLKPHAASNVCEEFLRGRLESAGVEVGPTLVRSASEIEEHRLIDRHYGALARLAMDTMPADLVISAQAEAAFESSYGLTWSSAQPSMLRNDEALTRLKVDGGELERMWRGGAQLKLAPGTYISKFDGTSGAEPCFTLNGFYPAMRQKFVEDGAVVRCMECEWDESRLTWKAFRREVIGSTDPTQATAGSVRAEMYARWTELGLAAQPSTGENCVHASAGPLEGLKERVVWTGAPLETDAFAATLLGPQLSSALTRPVLEQWLDDNPIVTLGGSTDKVFDLTEELSADEVVELVRGWES